MAFVTAVVVNTVAIVMNATFLAADAGIPWLHIGAIGFHLGLMTDSLIMTSVRKNLG